MISVIIPCYQAEATIAAALESVRAQRMAVEVLVVDDGSSDRGPEIVARDFPEARLLRVPHGGTSRARNAGTAAASAPFLQYLDQDDLLADGKLAVQLEALEKTGADIAYGAWRPMTKMGDRWVPGEAVGGRMGEFPETQILSYFWCPPAAYLFRRSLVERTGGWDERVRFIEDVRFLLDCIDAGARFAPCDGVMAYYGVHEDQYSLRDRPEFLRQCLKNTAEIEARWAAGSVPAPAAAAHRKAILTSYEYIARASYGTDPGTFDKACAHLYRLDPRWLPRPAALRALSAVMGYRRAEGMAAAYRKTKKSLGL